MTPLLSLIYPCHNRADLFAHTLDSLICQYDPPAYEVLVIDDGSTDNLADVVRQYAHGVPPSFRLPLRYIRIDAKMPSPHSPVLAWNVGIKQAKGDVIVLSSPEIVHRRAQNLDLLFTGCMHGAHASAVIADVYDRTWADTEFNGWISGGPAKRALCFLAAFRATKLLEVGGFEERFMAGRAFDDNEFEERFRLNGGEYTFMDGRVIAEHLPHARPVDEIRDGVNRTIYNELRGQRTANVGREWGRASCIVEQWK